MTVFDSFWQFSTVVDWFFLLNVFDCFCLLLSVFVRFWPFFFYCFWLFWPLLKFFGRFWSYWLFLTFFPTVFDHFDSFFKSFLTISDHFFCFVTVVDSFLIRLDCFFWPYRYRLMVLTTPMVFTQTDGVVLVLLDHTRTRGPSVSRMRDFFCCQ